MIEPGADGRVRPIVMDFGIAREAGVESGLTEAGTVMGTPAYMAPEQARGAITEISRCTDVYSLGATLYELLTGQPPFTGGSLVLVLAKVMGEDPAPPRQLVPSLPVDLETITLKCLHKEPPQRYDSAKALAEDLQRYIDGDPIIARKSSLRYRLQKRVRKHKALLALSAASLLGITSLGVDGIQARLASARQAQRAKEHIIRARQLGQDVKEIEWFMRAVNELPLHDTTYEQGLIRTRMERLEGQLGDLGREGGSLAHYALGRGYLALQEPQHAYDHLLASWNGGNRSAELHYAIGRVLGQRYADALRAEQRHGNRKIIEERRQALERELLPEALLHLEQSRSVQLDSASYLEGLIAFYKRQLNDATAHADQALKQAPWLYEAMKLKADIHYERWRVAFSRGEGEKEKASLLEALKLYDQAATLGRSDVSVLEARADAWFSLLRMQYERGNPIAELLPPALAACQDTITVAPRRAAGYQLATSVRLLMAMQLLDAGKDPGPQVKEIQAVAEVAMKQNAANEFLYNALGGGLLLVLFFEEANQKPYSVSISDVIKYHRRAIELKPEFQWAYNDLAGAYLFRANVRIENLEDPNEDLQEALRNTEQAVRLNPDYITAYSNVTYFRYMMANYLVDHGRAATVELESGLHSGSECIAHQPSYADCYSNLALLHLTAARYYTHVSPQPERSAAALQQAITNLQEAEARGDKSLEHQQSLLAAYLMQAQQAVRSSQDAKAARARAQEALGACQALSEKHSPCTGLAAELELLAVKVPGTSERELQQALNRALTLATQSVSENPRRAESYRILAAVRLARAEGIWATRRRAAATAEIQEGLSAIACSVALNPGNPQGQAVRAALIALQAQCSGSHSSGPAPAKPNGAG